MTQVTWFNMQYRDSSPPEPRTYEIPEDPLSVRSKSILILEDDRDFADALKETLEEQDYRVTLVPNGTEGVQAVLAADFDAILCDMVMPNVPGDMFYLAVQRARPHLCPRFVFMTGQHSKSKVAEFLKEVPNQVLWKPFAMRELFGALETVTGRSR